MKILAPIHFRISVQSNDDIVAVLTHLGSFNNENQLIDGWTDGREDSKNSFHKKMMEADFLEEVEVADVEQVEGAGNIDDLLAGLGAFAVGKLEGDSSFNIIKYWEQDLYVENLEKFLCSWQKLRDAGPRRSGGRVGAHLGALTLIHLTDRLLLVRVSVLVLVAARPRTRGLPFADGLWSTSAFCQPVQLGSTCPSIFPNPHQVCC